MQYSSLIEKYQAFVASTMTDKPKSPEEFIHWATDELVAEAGEVKGVLAKARRKAGMIRAEDYDKLVDELGDVLWSLTASLKTINPEISLEELMELNMNKLQARIDKGIKYNGTS